MVQITRAVENADGNYINGVRESRRLRSANGIIAWWFTAWRSCRLWNMHIRAWRRWWNAHICLYQWLVVVCWLPGKLPNLKHGALCDQVFRRLQAVVERQDVRVNLTAPKPAQWNRIEQLENVKRWLVCVNAVKKATARFCWLQPVEVPSDEKALMRGAVQSMPNKQSAVSKSLASHVNKSALKRAL